MTLSQVQPSIAILIASGFEENHITAIQRQLMQSHAPFRMIAPEQGLVNGWQNNGWGHYFPVDEQISTTMGSDYDLLIIVGGERGVAKLKENPHTRRIVNHFLEAGKPVAAIGSGVGLLALSPKSAGLSVCASVEVGDELETAQVQVLETAQTVDGVVLTADGSNIEAWVEGLMGLIAMAAQQIQDAAEEDAQAAA